MFQNVSASFPSSSSLSWGDQPLQRSNAMEGSSSPAPAPRRRPFPTSSERWLMNAVSDYVLQQRPPELTLGIYRYLLTIQPETIAEAEQRGGSSSAAGEQGVGFHPDRWTGRGHQPSRLEPGVDYETKRYLEQHHVALTIEMWAEALSRERPQDCLRFSQNLFQAMTPPQPTRISSVAQNDDRRRESNGSIDPWRRDSHEAPTEMEDGREEIGSPDARKVDKENDAPSASPQASDRSPLSPSPISYMASMNASSFDPILPLPLKARPLRPGSPSSGGLQIPTVLVAYFSVYGHSEKLAESVAEGARAGFKQSLSSTTTAILNGAVVIRQIPDLYTAAQRQQVQHSSVVQTYPTLTLDDLNTAQGIILSFPAKFGIPPAPVLSLLEELMTRDGQGRASTTKEGTPPRNASRRSGSTQTSPHSQRGEGRQVSRPRDEQASQGSVLLGKVGAVAVSTATQHGGQEEAAEAVLGALLSLGCLVVGPIPQIGGASNPNPQISPGAPAVAGGGPFGAGTIAGIHGERDLDAVERTVAEGLGARVAGLVQQLYG